MSLDMLPHELSAVVNFSMHPAHDEAHKCFIWIRRNTRSPSPPWGTIYKQW